MHGFLDPVQKSKSHAECMRGGARDWIFGSRPKIKIARGMHARRCAGLEIFGFHPDNSEFSFLKSEFWKKHTETARNPDFTRLRIFGTVLKSENNTVQQYDLQNRRLVLFNLGTWGTEVPLSPVLHAAPPARCTRGASLADEADGGRDVPGSVG